jgi:hypothetical protein
MKYAIGIGVLIIGIGAGYWIGTQSGDSETTESEPITEFITHTVHDTIVHEETIKIPVAVKEIDSIDLISDSLLAINYRLFHGHRFDTLDNFSIVTEKMIASEWLTINVIEDFEKTDSLLKEALGISDNMPSEILVEFWESPLHFSGYKLSKSKLILFDMPNGLNYKFFRKKDAYFLSAETFYYSLKETEEFLPYLEVSKDVVFDD